MNNFLRTWYQSEIRPDQILDAFRSWFHTNWGDAPPSLVFTRPPDFTPWIKRTIGVEDIDPDGKILQLRLEVENGITDPWYETATVSDLPRIVTEFLWIDDPQELIYVTLGPTIRWWERISR